MTGVNDTIPAASLEPPNLRIDSEARQITNNDRANELLAGNAPRRGWEDFYKLA